MQAIPIQIKQIVFASGNIHAKYCFRGNVIGICHTNGKKMLHSSLINRLLLFFIIFIRFLAPFAHSDDSTDDETVVEGN